MWFQTIIKHGKLVDGFWMCPTPNCGGAGFQFDIFPVDPSHPANAGWTYSDDEEEGEWDEEAGGTVDEAVPYDPSEPEFAELDEEAHAEGDIEGEEWKLGIAPADVMGQVPEISQGQRQWDAEQKRFDMPDERPRSIDRSDEPEPPPLPFGGNDDDIPF